MSHITNITPPPPTDEVTILRPDLLIVGESLAVALATLLRSFDPLRSTLCNMAERGWVVTVGVPCPGMFQMHAAKIMPDGTQRLTPVYSQNVTLDNLITELTQVLREISKACWTPATEANDALPSPLDAAKPTSSSITDDPTDPRIRPYTGPEEPGPQNEAYLVLSEEERAKGFVRPLRFAYIHDKCGVVTRMGRALAETYARSPSFYAATYCCGCAAHFPVGEFKWDGTEERVGS